MDWKGQKNYAEEESLSWTSSEKLDLDQDGEGGRNYAPQKVRVAFDKKSRKNSNASVEELCVGVIGKYAMKKGVRFDKQHSKGTLLLLIIGN